MIYIRYKNKRIIKRKIQRVGRAVLRVVASPIWIPLLVYERLKEKRMAAKRKKRTEKYLDNNIEKIHEMLFFCEDKKIEEPAIFIVKGSWSDLVVGQLKGEVITSRTYSYSHDDISIHYDYSSDSKTSKLNMVNDILTTISKDRSLEIKEVVEYDECDFYKSDRWSDIINKEFLEKDKDNKSIWKISIKKNR